MGQGRVFTCPDVRPRLSSPATCCCALTLEPLARQLGNDSPPAAPVCPGEQPVSSRVPELSVPAVIRGLNLLRAATWDASQGRERLPPQPQQLPAQAQSGDSRSCGSDASQVQRSACGPHRQNSCLQLVLHAQCGSHAPGTQPM